MNKLFNRGISLLLLAALMLSMAACGGEAEPTDPVETTNPVETTAPVETTTPVETTPSEVSAVTYFSMSLGENYDNIVLLTAYPNADGTAYVDYTGKDTKKVGNLDASVLTTIAQELAKTELASLVGQDIFGEGEANASMYIEYTDGTSIMVSFTGQIPETYTQGFAVMETCFQQLTADLPEYVPTPMVMGDVDATLLSELNTILGSSGIEALDGFAISGIATGDEFFAYSAGLTSSEGISAAASCAPMMMTNAYSLVIVTLSDESKAADVAADFEKNIDWRKWVCVAPDDALIAQKGNMVLCLIAGSEQFTQTRNGIQAAGWTELKTLSNPDR